MPEVLESLSPSEFFYRYKDLVGFTNPTRAVYLTVRELLENSLDSAEVHGIPPIVNIRIARVTPKGAVPSDSSVDTLMIHVDDNAGGIPPQRIPDAFGKVLVSSKYRLRQQRGLFGLGGKMALIYAQSTTHQPFVIQSGFGKKKPIVEYTMLVDIEKNEPKILKRRRLANVKSWRGISLDLVTRGDWSHAKSKVLNYLSNTAIAAPYATITFKDPDGNVLKFEPATNVMPKPPTETKPHPAGLDVETLRRIINASTARDLQGFLRGQFQRVGPVTAKQLLEYAGFHGRKAPHKLTRDELLQLSNAMNTYQNFKAPDASCLSPIGEEQLRAGIKAQLNPAFVAVVSRRAASYAGFPFIVEAAVAFGGDVPVNETGKVPIIRYANKIPLLFDEGGDVSRKVVDDVNWRLYHVESTMPVVVITSIVSTRIAWRSAGKEIVADRPEIERELLNTIRECARQLGHYLSRKSRIAQDKKRLDVYVKYLPKIATFTTTLAGKNKVPTVDVLLKAVTRFTDEELEGKSTVEHEETPAETATDAKKAETSKPVTIKESAPVAEKAELAAMETGHPSKEGKKNLADNKADKKHHKKPRHR